MKAAVIVFPGSNCDRDVQVALQQAGAEAHMVWHRDADLPAGTDLVVVPGGFSYGDYLRSGAMAAHSPIMQQVKTHAAKGGYVLGICNGFQILTEAGLLPGVLMRNKHLKFVCKDVFLRVENTQTIFTKGYKQRQVIRVPIAHHDGNYNADADTLKALEDNGQVAFRYVTANGNEADEANPNGSSHHIAGVFNAQKNVLGLMPHPERLAEAALGGIDGAPLFRMLVAGK